MWDELYETYQKELLRYAARMCGNGELAQDIVQETFLKALQSGDIFEELGPSQRRAWLYKTMKNLFFDHYRRSQTESAYIDALQTDTAYWEPGIQKTENALLLAQLSPEDRALFHLRYEEGYTAAELAAMFHLPPGTIRSRLSRCRGILKKLLLEE